MAVRQRVSINLMICKILTLKLLELLELEFSTIYFSVLAIINEVLKKYYKFDYPTIKLTLNDHSL